MLKSAENLVLRMKTNDFIPVALQREDEDGVVFLSCADLPELFVAVPLKSNEQSDLDRAAEEIRQSIGRCLSNAFMSEGRKVSVYTNGSITGPTIEAAVRIYPAT